MIIATAMRIAFENIRVAPSAYEGNGPRIGSDIYDALETKTGVIKVNDRLNLSFRTFKDLKAKELLPAWAM